MHLKLNQDLLKEHCGSKHLDRFFLRNIMDLWLSGWIKICWRNTVELSNTSYTTCMEDKLQT